LVVKVFRRQSAGLNPADPRTFAGHAETERLLSNDESAVHVYRVQFEHGGRTNWHTHSGPQWLVIVEGRVRVQRAGEPPQDLDAGDVVVIAPGEKHWHGAPPGSHGAHVAINIDARTEWLEPVTDEQYVGAEHSTS
jgi:quercetin dioxygenase-like cupin family protein